jgi:hypothetical protein
MRRTYIVAVLLLLGAGVVSTLALGTFSQSLTETVLTEYTLNYDESSATLSAPSTSTSSTDTITVDFTVTQADPHLVDISIQAFSGTDGTGAINADATGATYSYTVTYSGGDPQTASDVAIATGNPLTFDIATTDDAHTITGLTITFVNDGLVLAYNSMVVDVSDA